MNFALNHPVRCRDGGNVTLSEVIIDPDRRRVTHVVLRDSNRPDAVFLVPCDQLDADPDGVVVRLEEAELARFPHDEREIDGLLPIRWDLLEDEDSDVRQGSSIYAADDHRVGTVDGLICDDSCAITHIVLRHGVLFGRRDIVVPVQQVARLGVDEIVLGLTKAELAGYPSEPLDDWLDRPPS